MLELQPPVLSQFDPVTESEGSIDPLGLLGIYERLADRILPAITVRMSRPRFVTAIAVGARVCGEWDPDVTAADGISPPWLVFEWHVVEALARCQDELADSLRIPGLFKVRTALRNGRPIGDASYLKTPKVFGYTGVYKRLAIGLRVVNDEMTLDENGWELLAAWAADQELDGFLDSGRGTGAALRGRWHDMVQRALPVGHTTSRSVDLWRELALRLEPAKIGGREKKALYRQLRNAAGAGAGATEAASLTAEMIDAIETHGAVLARADETSFLRRLARKASAPLAVRLDAIDAYEGLCRRVVDAFDLVRHLSTAARRDAVGVSEFVAHPLAAKLADGLLRAADRILHQESLLDWEPDARDLAARYAIVSSPAALFEAVLEHHDEAQRRKPPDGKRPWIERLPDSRAAVRVAYALDRPPSGADEYVHEYRVPTLSGFLADLARLR
jgi:hypothetical protein